MAMLEHNQADDSVNENKSISEIELYDPRAIERLNFEDACKFYQLVVRKTNEIIPMLFEKGRADGVPLKNIRVKMHEMGIPERTMIRYTPDWAKQKQDHSSRTKKGGQVATFPSNQAKLADVTPVNIPPPEQPIIEPEREQELVHKTIRITMSGKKLGSLGYAMIDKVKELGLDTKYAIEYDYVDKELYLDVAEGWETKLMVND
jgi:hypothetical protein